MAEEKKLDETIPGGVYIVGGQTVNANGEAVNKQPSTPKTQNAFPEDFPGFDVLGQVENMTPERLASMSDEEILNIKGIGPKTLEEIRAYGK